MKTFDHFHSRSANLICVLCFVFILFILRDLNENSSRKRLTIFLCGLLDVQVKLSGAHLTPASGQSRLIFPSHSSLLFLLTPCKIRKSSFSSFALVTKRVKREMRGGKEEEE